LEILNGVFQGANEFLEVRGPDLLVFATKNERFENTYQKYLRRESSTQEALGYGL